MEGPDERLDPRLKQTRPEPGGQQRPRHQGKDFRCEPLHPLNYWIVACGGSPETTQPTLVGVENPSSATIVCQGETFTFKLDQALADNGGIFLVIEATEGQSKGVSRAHSKAAQIKMVEEPTATAIDIRAYYVAKNGAPSAAVPKIFFRYYYVNSSTGEKSGVMLAETTWTAGA